MYPAIHFMIYNKALLLQFHFYYISYIYRLIGRDLVSLRDFEKEGIHQILWTAKDLKMRMEDDGAVS